MHEVGGEAALERVHHVGQVGVQAHLGLDGRGFQGPGFRGAGSGVRAHGGGVTGSIRLSSWPCMPGQRTCKGGSCILHTQHKRPHQLGQVLPGQARRQQRVQVAGSGGGGVAAGGGLRTSQPEARCGG